MRNRNKHKKTNNATQSNKQDHNTENNQEPKSKDVNNQTQSKSGSRSRSRGRRSLSALFRRSTERDEGYDEDNEPITDAVDDPVDGDLSDINPRLDPRGHLQRMTVREALVYNKKRGRSPNRKALKLAKKLMPDEISLSRDSLSSSMPDLLEQISDCVNDTSGPGRFDIRGGSTLPRMKKQHRPALDTASTINLDHVDETDNALPLDKRKYLIKKDDEMETEIKDIVPKSDKRSSIVSHSKPSSENVSDKNERLSNENRRRGSYTKFMELQEISPEISVLPSASKPIMPSNTVKDVPNISISKSTTQESLIQPVVHSDTRAEIHHIETLDNHKGNTTLHRLSETYVFEGKDEAEPKQIDRQFSTMSTDTNRSNGSRRNSYVSPRRFSRASRTSLTSNKSNLSNSSNQSATGNHDQIAQKLSPLESSKGKYSRQFSRESSRERKVMVNKETNTDNGPVGCKYVDSATQTIDIQPSIPKCVDVACQNSDDMMDKEDGEDASDIDADDADVFRPELKREVVIVEQRVPTKRVTRKSVDSVFKPIVVSNKQRKVSEQVMDNTIERLPEVNEKKEDKENRKSTKKRSKKSNKRRKSTSSSKTRDRSSEGDEHLTAEMKIRRSKSMSAQPVSRKESQSSRGKDVKKEEIKVVRRSSSGNSGKRSKSLPRKSSKEKSDKTVARALKKAGRAASLSEVFESSESLRKEDNKKSGKLQKPQRSLSMDSVDLLKEPSVKFQDSLKKLKAEKKKQPKLSLVAVVALKSRLSRMKKAKQNNKDKNEDDRDEHDTQDNERNIDDEDEPNVDDDLNTAKVYYENEINTSIGKSTNSLEMIEDVDKEVKDIVYEKRIQFSTPYCDDPMTEEELIKQRQRNTRLVSRRESKVRQRQKKVISCCKKFIAFLFSHIGLCSLVVAYCILGGFIFKELEGPHEMQKKREITGIRQNYTGRIYRLAFEKRITKGNRELFRSEVDSILRDFSVVIHKQTKEAGWDGQEIRNVTANATGPPEPEQWSYPSSLLYAITVMTTIGYGHVAPKTDEGRIMTIAYAVLGIPLTLLCLTNIGDVMAHGFRWLYGRVCCGVCCILFRPRRRRRLDPEKGIPAERMIMQEEEKSTEVTHVPTSVCLLLMTSYIMIGTILFSYVEAWDMVTGTYFCFITLSTIGFGDVVPGMSQKEWSQQWKLVSCALYLVIGLSLIAMCFNLVQEDVKAKCKWLGMKLGIIDKPVSSV